MESALEIREMEKRVEKIKSALRKVGAMRPGSLNQQRTVCGRPGCRCQDPKNPQKQGPYYQLSYVHQGKSTTRFIQKPLVPMVARQLKNFKTFTALTTEWVNLSLAIAKQKLALDRQKLKAPQKYKPN
jgi:hypothetical protein